MKIGRHLVITLLILPLIVFFGCSRPNQEVSAAGTIENSIYKNSYFGMEIPFQKSWHILDARMVRALEQYGAKAVAGSNRNDIEQTKHAISKVENLVMATMYPISGEGYYNPSFTCTALSLNVARNISSGKDYLLLVRNSPAPAKFAYSDPSDIRQSRIDGVLFYVLARNTKYSGFDIHQEIYATVVKNYLLSFILTSETNEQCTALLQVLGKVRFH